MTVNDSQGSGNSCADGFCVVGSSGYSRTHGEDGDSTHYNGDGYGQSCGEGLSNVVGHGAGCELDYYSRTDGSGDMESVGSILIELGVPKHLHAPFLPLNQSKMLAAYDFAQAATQEQRDAVLGMLELEQEQH